MEWISVKDRKPYSEYGTSTVYVTNIKRGFFRCIALYYQEDDVFTEFNPESFTHPPLEVTHWFELPNEFPEKGT